MTQKDQLLAAPPSGGSALREAVAWAYQAIGVLWPSREALDNLSAALRGEAALHEWPVVHPTAMKPETEIRQMLTILRAFNGRGKHNDEIKALEWVLGEYPPPQKDEARGPEARDASNEAGGGR